MTLNKADLIEQVYLTTGFSKRESLEIVEEVFEILKSTLASGEGLKISGFGTFKVNNKKPRKGRNPQTGEEIIIDGRKIVTFKPSQLLKEQINEE